MATIYTQNWTDFSASSIYIGWDSVPFVEKGYCTFDGTTGYKLTSVDMLLARSGTRTANVTMYIYACNGTVPTGSPLATSDPVAFNSLQDTYEDPYYAFVNFTFTGAEQIGLTTGTDNYASVIYYDDSVGQTTVVVFDAFDDNTNVAGYYTSSAWSNLSYGHPIIVYGEVSSTTYTKTVTEKARIKTLNTQIITPKADIAKFGTTTTETSKARIQHIETKTIQPKAKVIHNITEDATAKADIFKVNQGSVTTKARVMKPDSTKNIQAKARLVRTQTPETVTVKAKMIGVGKKNIQAKGYIGNIGNVGIKSKARINKEQLRIAEAKARIQGTNNFSVTAGGSIKYEGVTQTLTAKGAITKSGITSYLLTQARLVNTLTKTLRAKGRVRSINRPTVTAKSRVKHLQTGIDTYARANIYKQLGEIIQAQALISNQYIYFLQAKARVWDEPVGLKKMYSSNFPTSMKDGRRI